MSKNITGKIERRKNGLLVKGRIKDIGYELDVWSEGKRSGGDVIVKINFFSGKNEIGETYRVSPHRAEKVAPKFSIKAREFISELRRRK